MESRLLEFCIVAGVLTITPGADTMLVMKNTFRGGHSDGFSTTFGICFGLLIHASLSSLGLSVILAKSAILYNTVKWAGACYLIWLGIQAIWGTGQGQKAFARVSGSSKDKISLKRSFLEGFVSNILNPKVAVFYLALLPQFVSNKQIIFMEYLSLASIHIVMGVIWLCGISIFFSYARAFVSNPRFRFWLARISGGILILLGIRVALEES